jgi:glycogen phosphorylase
MEQLLATYLAENPGLGVPAQLPTQFQVRVALFRYMLGKGDVCSLFSEHMLLKGQSTGGLGALLKDQIETAVMLGLEFTGFAPYYLKGYFTQIIGAIADGRIGQLEEYPEYPPDLVPELVLTDYRVAVPYQGRLLHGKVYLWQIGPTVRLYFFDSHVAENDTDLQEVTDHLYGGDRLGTETLLGKGAVQLRAQLAKEWGYWPACWHLNECHPLLALYELVAMLMERGLPFKAAVAAVRAWTVGTIHTPVDAGITRRSPEDMHAVLDDIAERCRIPFEVLYALGEDHPGSWFNMARALIMLSTPNAVSRLHQQVAARMFAKALVESGNQMSVVTNGVSHKWVSPPIAELFARHIGPDWFLGNQADWERGVEAITTAELEQVHEANRVTLADYVFLHTGIVLDPKACRLGFARRVPSYKRLTLLLTQPVWFKWLLTQTDKPVYLIMAGKSHPGDEFGKALIEQLIRFVKENGLEQKVIFLPEYDADLASVVIPGVDVWLNNPLRPLEACGTSGMKAALNGGLNMSIRDGWWDEFFVHGTGFAPGGLSELAENAAPDVRHQQDLADARAMLEAIEHEALRIWFEVDDQGQRTNWYGMVKHAYRIFGRELLGARMLWEYLVRLYMPAAHMARLMRIAEILDTEPVSREADLKMAAELAA